MDVAVRSAEREIDCHIEVVGPKFQFASSLKDCHAVANPAAAGTFTVSADSSSA